jgi:hypothetical protein
MKHSDQSGMVTVELALAMPVVVAFIAFALGAGTCLISAIQCNDAAGAVARAHVSRQASGQEALIARQLAGDSTEVSVTRNGQWVDVVVAKPAPFPGVVIRGRASARVEPDGTEPS